MTQQASPIQMRLDTPSVSARILRIDENGVYGWALAKPHWWSRPQITAKVDGKRLCSTTANQFDPNLQRQFPATDGKIGFTLNFDRHAREELTATGGDITVYVATATGEMLLADCRVKISNPAPARDALKGITTMLEESVQLFRDFRGTQSRAADLKPQEVGVQPLFHRLTEPRTVSGGSDPQGGHTISAFVELVIHATHTASDRLLRPGSLDSGLSHLASIAKLAAKGLRIPLCAEELDFLNEPVAKENGALPLTRFSRAVLSRRGIATDFPENDRAAWFQAVFQYCTELAPSLNVEDCLVPELYVKLLSGTPRDKAGFDYPISHFAAQMFYSLPALRALDLEEEADRRMLICALLVLCAKRPGYFPYMNPQGVRQVFETSEDGKTHFGQFLAVITGDDCLSGLGYSDYRGLLLEAGFDVSTKRFATITSRGDRLAPAALRAPADDEAVDVQFIGPVTDKTGLGLASRLEAKILMAAGANPNIVEMSFYDAARLRPEELRIPISPLKRSSINIIHHNGDQLPLVLAASPDVFSGAYNIGYFAWELDSPAKCHYLALDLLDEIWVQSDYNVQSYAPHCRIPVVNVGMSFETPPDIDKRMARRYVEDTYSLPESHTIFLTVFDALSDVRRKNPLAIIKAFQAAFGPAAPASLLIKTQNKDRVRDPYQAQIFEEIEALIRGDRRVQLVDASLSHGELMRLIKGSDCYVSLHRSEGWGFGMIEAMALGVPVLCTGYSGNMEFCKPDTAWLVDYRLVELAKEDFIYTSRGQRWAEPDVPHAARLMAELHVNKILASNRAAHAQIYVHRNFSTATISVRVAQRLSEIRKLIANQAPHQSKAIQEKVTVNERRCQL